MIKTIALPLPLPRKFRPGRIVGWALLIFTTVIALFPICLLYTSDAADE